MPALVELKRCTSESNIKLIKYIKCKSKWLYVPLQPYVSQANIRSEQERLLCIWNDLQHGCCLNICKEQSWNHALPISVVNVLQTPQHGQDGQGEAKLNWYYIIILSLTHMSISCACISHGAIQAWRLAFLYVNVCTNVWTYERSFGDHRPLTRPDMMY